MEVTVKIKVKDGVEIELSAEEIEKLREALNAFAEKETVYVPSYPYWRWGWWESNTTPRVTYGNDYTVTLLASGQ
jgi:hypothetical protein